MRRKTTLKLFFNFGSSSSKWMQLVCDAISPIWFVCDIYTFIFFTKNNFFSTPTRSNTEALFWSICWKLNRHEANLKRNHNTWWFTSNTDDHFLRLRLSLSELSCCSQSAYKVVKKETIGRITGKVVVPEDCTLHHLNRLVREKWKWEAVPVYLSAALVARLLWTWESLFILWLYVNLWSQKKMNLTISSRREFAAFPTVSLANHDRSCSRHRQNVHSLITYNEKLL